MYSQCGKTLPERRSVVGNDDQFSLSHSQGFEGLFVAQLVFAGLHDKGQSAVDRLDGLLLLLLGSHGGLTSFLEGRNDKSAPIHAKCCVEKNDRKKKFHRVVFLL